MTKRQKFIFGIGSVGTLSLVVGCLVFFLSQSLTGKTDAELTEDQPLPVNVKTIERVESFDVTRRYTGVLKSQQDANLGFELGGRIVSIKVDEGDSIGANQVLADLDTTLLAANKSSAEANLAQAKAVLEELLAGPRKEVILAAESNMLATKSEYENAKYNSKRRRSLAESKAISDEEYDQSVFAEQAALARWTAAKERVNELKTGTRPEKIAAAKAAVAQMEAAIHEINVSIDKSVLRAPFDGTIISRFVDPGSIVDAGTPVVKLQQHLKLEAWFGVPVKVASRLKVGDSLSVSVEGRTYEGKLKSRIRTLSTATRTQSIVVELNNGIDDPIVSGQVCKLELSDQIDGEGYWVPTTALTQGVRGLWSLLVINDQNGTPIAEKRDVTVIYTDVDRTLVRGTLSGELQIIVDGVHRIVPGQEVDPVPFETSKDVDKARVKDSVRVPGQTNTTQSLLAPTD